MDTKTPKIAFFMVFKIRVSLSLVLLSFLTCPKIFKHKVQLWNNRGSYMSAHEHSSIRIPLEKAWELEADGDIINATAAYGMVFFMSKDNGIHALDAASGQQRWMFKMDDIVRRPLIVTDGILYVFGTSKDKNDRNLYAIDAQTGEKRWQFSISNGGRIPLLFNEREHVWLPFVKNGVVYIVNDDKTLYAINAQTGLERWRFSTNKDIGYPTFGYGMVFFGSKDKRVYALDSNSGEKRWEFESGHKNYCCPIVTDGKLLIGGDDDLYALDSNSGTLLWKIKKILHYGSNHGYGNPPIVMGNRVICPKELTGIDLASGEITAKLQPKTKYYNYFYEKNEIPYMVKNVFAENGILYMANNGFIYALDTRAREWKWHTFIEEELGRFLGGEFAGWTISGDYLFATAYHSMKTHGINISKPKLHWWFGPYSVPVIMSEMAFVYWKKEMCGYTSSKDPERLVAYDAEMKYAPLFPSKLKYWGWSGQIVWPNCCCICCGPPQARINITKEVGKESIVIQNVPYCRKCLDEGNARERQYGFWMVHSEKPPNLIGFENSKYATMFWIANRLR